MLARQSPLMREAMSDSRSRLALVEAVRRTGKKGAPTYTVDIDGQTYVISNRRRLMEKLRGK